VTTLSTEPMGLPSLCPRQAYSTGPRGAVKSRVRAGLAEPTLRIHPMVGGLKS